MSAQVWLIIAIVGFSLSAIALIIAIVMFIKMDIPSIIGDLSGKTVAREVKAMHDANLSNRDNKYHPINTNMDRRDNSKQPKQNNLDADALKKVHASKRLDYMGDKVSQVNGKNKGDTVGIAEFEYDYSNNTASGFNGMEATDILSDNATEVLSDDATEVLSNEATEVLNDNATEVLSSDTTEVLKEATTNLSDNKQSQSGETTVLSNGTTVLSQTEELDDNEIMPVEFKVIRSEILIHTDEVI